MGYRAFGNALVGTQQIQCQEIVPTHRFAGDGKRFDARLDSSRGFLSCETGFLWYSISATRPGKISGKGNCSVNPAHAACDAFVECDSFNRSLGCRCSTRYDNQLEYSRTAGLASHGPTVLRLPENSDHVDITVAQRTPPEPVEFRRCLVIEVRTACPGSYLFVGRRTRVCLGDIHGTTPRGHIPDGLADRSRDSSAASRTYPRQPGALSK